MSDQITAKEAEEKALETLFNLTEELTKGEDGASRRFIEPEVRLNAAKELLKYVEQEKDWKE